ncbi:hypothetical protein ACWD4B_15855 [Streptomyces sp. NPDC002536]
MTGGDGPLLTEQTTPSADAPNLVTSVERPDVYVIHNQGPLDLTGRVVNHGKT